MLFDTNGLKHGVDTRRVLAGRARALEGGLCEAPNALASERREDQVTGHAGSAP